MYVSIYINMGNFPLPQEYLTLLGSLLVLGSECLESGNWGSVWELAQTEGNGIHVLQIYTLLRPLGEPHTRYFLPAGRRGTAFDRPGPKDPAHNDRPSRSLASGINGTLKTFKVNGTRLFYTALPDQSNNRASGTLKYAPLAINPQFYT
jgi:hypothetical protein